MESDFPDGMDQCRVLATSANLFLHVARPTLGFYPEKSLAQDWKRLDSKWSEFWRRSSKRLVDEGP